MANTFQGSPPIWVLDTASGTPVSTDQVRISRIRWVAGPASAAGGECKITDAAGNLIFDEFSTGADFETPDFAFDKDKGKSFIGVILSVLASGKVYVYLA